PFYQWVGSSLQLSRSRCKSSLLTVCGKPPWELSPSHLSSVPQLLRHHGSNSTLHNYNKLCRSVHS
ncbi:hypothetical protein LINGRAHAP2_LOCUS22755, partial [Linum grandiflorum]